MRFNTIFFNFVVAYFFGTILYIHTLYIDIRYATVCFRLSV